MRWRVDRNFRHYVEVHGAVVHAQDAYGGPIVWPRTQNAYFSDNTVRLS